MGLIRDKWGMFWEGMGAGLDMSWCCLENRRGVANLIDGVLLE